MGKIEELLIEGLFDSIQMNDGSTYQSTDLGETWKVLEDKINKFDNLLSSIASKFNHLDWIYGEPSITSPEDAIKALETHYIHLFDSRSNKEADETLIAMSMINELIDSEPLFSPKWIPTEHEIRINCGIWVCRGKPNRKIYVTPEYLSENFKNCSHFETSVCWNYKKIEMIPEQCIPKKEPTKERYQVKFPLLAGIK